MKNLTAISVFKPSSPHQGKVSMVKSSGKKLNFHLLFKLMISGASKKEKKLVHYKGFHPSGFLRENKNSKPTKALKNVSAEKTSSSRKKQKNAGKDELEFNLRGERLRLVRDGEKIILERVPSFEDKPQKENLSLDSLKSFQKMPPLSGKKAFTKKDVPNFSFIPSKENLTSIKPSKLEKIFLSFISHLSREDKLEFNLKPAKDKENITPEKILSQDKPQRQSFSREKVKPAKEKIKGALSGKVEAFSHSRKRKGMHLSEKETRPIKKSPEAIRVTEKERFILTEGKIKREIPFSVEMIQQREVTRKTSPNHPVRASELIDRIINEIKLVKSERQTQARFFIKSEEFGSIRVHLVMEKNNLMLQIQVSEAKTGQLIQNNFHYLKQNLEKEGIFLKDFSMDFNQNMAGFDEERPKTKYSPLLQRPEDNFKSLEEEKEDLQVSLHPYYINYLV